jgi:hypothetical protein
VLTFECVWVEICDNFMEAIVLAETGEVAKTNKKSHHHLPSTLRKRLFHLFFYIVRSRRHKITPILRHKPTLNDAAKQFTNK